MGAHTRKTVRFVMDLEGKQSVVLADGTTGVPQIADTAEVIEAAAEPGQTILQVARNSGVEIEAACGGKGRCGQCRVKVWGKLAPPTDTEYRVLDSQEFREGIRLACQAKIQGDITVMGVGGSLSFGEKHSTQKILTYGLETEIELKPTVNKRYVEVVEPSLEDQRGDFERLAGALGLNNSERRLSVLRPLPSILRSSGSKVTAVISEGQILAVEPGDTTDKFYGIAFDIGTTTVVGGLVDLTTGREIAVASSLNEQALLGADVISRVNYVSEEKDGLSQLQKRVLKTINGIIKELLDETGVDPKDIWSVTVVGNTCMQHLFLGVDPTYLARAPYIPSFQGEVMLKARELGLRLNPDAEVRVAPNIAGFVGGDTVGVILATGLYEGDGARLAIDLGTNGEMAARYKGRLLVCSTAAGPAFEGAQISQGMRAVAGAIESVKLVDGKIKLGVIGDETPKGICGSGLIDAVAVLLELGAIDATGRLLDAEEAGGKLSPEIASRFVQTEKGPAFVLWEPESGSPGGDKRVLLTQADIRQLQLAKGAIRAGTRILLKELGISDEDLDEVMLAGAFGNYIRKESALRMGLLPDVPLNKVKSVGNAARIGAKMALISNEARIRESDISRQGVHVELSGRPDFQEAFMDAMLF